MVVLFKIYNNHKHRMAVSKIVMPDALSGIYYLVSKDQNKFITVDDLYKQFCENIELEDECKKGDFPDLCQQAIDKYDLKCRRFDFKPSLIYWTRDELCIPPKFKTLDDISDENIINSIEDILIHKDYYPWANDEYLMNQFCNGYPAIYYVVKYGRFDLFKMLINTNLYFSCDLFDTWVGNATSEMLCYYNEKLIQYSNDQINDMNARLRLLKAINTKLTDGIKSSDIKNIKLTDELKAANLELVKIKNVNNKKKSFYQSDFEWIIMFDVFILSIIMMFFLKNN